MLELHAAVLKPGAGPISHRFEAGTISVVLGSNHAGKTRLTRVVAGLDPCVSGSLSLNGEALEGVPPGDRSVALVYQSFVNYPNWTVYQNLASPLVARKIDAQAARAEVQEIAAKLGLEDFLDRLPQALSGGQQQRLAIGRALAKRAQALVLDEPLVNLDYKLREALQLELRGLLHDLDLCVIYTSSDPRDAFALADELVLLAEHEVLQSGSPLEVYNAPVSPAAADLMSDPRANRVPAGVLPAGLQAGDFDALVRPEHLYLNRHAEDDVTFPVEVLGSETNGSETFLHCRLDGAGKDRHWVAHLDGLVPLAAGSRVPLFAPAASILRFPQDIAAGGGERAVG